MILETENGVKMFIKKKQLKLINKVNNQGM